MVSIISLHGPVYLNFYQTAGAKEPLARVLLEHRSLVVFRDDLFTGCVHEIQEVTSETVHAATVNLDKVSLDVDSTFERKKRVSVTIRFVPPTVDE